MQFIRNLLKRKNSQKRSVVFYHHSYYHFYYLAKALRERGWDAITVNIEPINGPHKNYYHGEDINLYDPNPKKFKRNITRFYNKALKRFNLFHFAGDTLMSFYPENYNADYPNDILEWKKYGNKVAYTISGCISGVSQSMIGKWSIANNNLKACDRCAWQDVDMICNDTKNLSWGKKVHQHCDLIFSETLPSLDYMQTSPKIVREPTTTCLDPNFWDPNLAIPDEHRVENPKNELLIYHAFGNYETRNNNKKNIKGTPYIINAIERLKKEGHQIKFIFITDKPNTEVRFYQLQADIIVDQLNIGRYGASAREGLMLGKPVICYLNKFEFSESDRLECLNECPIVSATEQTIYDELKRLILSPELRHSLGKRGREYALKWHSADNCAERYEIFYDRLFS